MFAELYSLEQFAELISSEHITSAKDVSLKSSSAQNTFTHMSDLACSHQAVIPWARPPGRFLVFTNFTCAVSQLYTPTLLLSYLHRSSRLFAFASNLLFVIHYSLSHANYTHIACIHLARFRLVSKFRFIYHFVPYFDNIFSTYVQTSSICFTTKEIADKPNLSKTFTRYFVHMFNLCICPFNILINKTFTRYNYLGIYIK